MAYNDYSPKLPRVAVGALVLHEGKILLVERGKPPAQGVWALPGGRVKWGETLVEAIKREVKEETGIEIDVGEIIYTFDSITQSALGEIDYHYVIIDFLAHPIEPVGLPQASDDAADAAWVTPAQIDTLPMSQTTLELIHKIVIDNHSS